LLVLTMLGPTAHLSNTPRTVRTYKSGHLLYLESTNGTDTIRVALDSAWGGAIVLVSYDGRELVNRSDPGREVQIALWDGEQTYDPCAGCSGTFGWNPVQAGDRYHRGSPVIDDSLASDHLYTRTRPIEWYPDNKGGGKTGPVVTDIVMEQWISVARWDWRIIQVRYRVTYAGTTAHANSSQELPAVYVNGEYPRFVYYSGGAPWTNAAVIDTTLPVPPPVPILYMPEKWAALVDAQGFGLTVYAPEQYPYGGGRLVPGTTGPMGRGTVYYRPLVYYSVLPGHLLTGSYVLIPGDYRTARRLIYSARDSMASADVVTPFGYVDVPRAGATVRGTTLVGGWAIDNASVGRVDVYVDGTDVGQAQYELPRPDVQHAYVGAPTDVGYRFAWDTRLVRNGEHTLQVRVTDINGNVALFKRVMVTVSN